jgi:hypothetical protein
VPQPPNGPAAPKIVGTMSRQLLGDLAAQGERTASLIEKLIEEAVREGDDRRVLMLDEVLQGVEGMLALAKALRRSGLK